MDFKWIGATAAVGAVVGLWNQLKALFSYLRSIFIVTRVVSCWNTIDLEICSYIRKNCYIPKLGDRYYKFEMYEDNNRHTKLVVAENICQKCTFLAFHKGIPLLVSMTPGRVSISYVRGTFNINKFFDTVRESAFHVMEEHTRRTEIESEEYRERFYFKHVWGSLTDDQSKKKYDDEVMQEKPRSIGSPDQPDDGQFTVSDAHVQAGSVRIISQTDMFSALKVDPQKSRKEWLDRIYMTDKQRTVLKEIQYWLKEKDWYESKKIPWKRGFLLSGPPGTGKSSLVFALARMFDIPIEIMHLNTMTNKDLTGSWYGAGQTGVIRLIEDIDGVFEGRRNIHESKHRPFLTFDCLLNTLDGVEQTQGVLTFITTNHPEKLDPALGGGVNGDDLSTRPGRIDKIVKFDLLEEEGRRFIVDNILDDWTKHERDVFMREYCNKPAAGTVVQEACTKHALEKKWKAIQ